MRGGGASRRWLLPALWLAGCVDLSAPAEVKRCRKGECDAAGAGGAGGETEGTGPLEPEAGAPERPGPAIDAAGAERPVPEPGLPERMLVEPAGEQGPPPAEPARDAAATERVAEEARGGGVPDAEPADAADAGGVVDTAAAVDAAEADQAGDGPADAPPDAPVLLTAGAPCMAGGQCLSSFCVDGFCCATACAGLCQACNLADAVGTCVPVPAGQDPQDECVMDPASTCSRDGTCDGRGGCRLFAAGTQCAPQTCSGSTETAARSCDGAGLCRTPVTRDCAPYQCAGAACGTTCATDAVCQAGHFCDAGMCKPRRTNGMVCTAGSQCGSGFCVDGVCCTSACTGPCQACNVTGALGMCAPIAAGLDPDSECPTDDPSTCMRDGACNGAGGCRLYSAGTMCAAQTCTAAVETSARSCDGAGTCGAATMRSCAPYACAGNACASSCAAQTDCPATHYCDAGMCKPKQGNGNGCSMGFQCTSGQCFDGVCCNVACSGLCQACNLTGSLGTCAPVPAGQDPDGECPAEDPTTCMRDGACNGNGACRLFQSGTQCAAQSCASGVESAARTCDGAGTCQAATTKICSPYVCQGASCGTTCSGATGCASGYYCDGVQCLPK